MLGEARARLRRIRYTRKTPFIDTTIFANYNGMMISAYADTYKELKTMEIKEFALKTLDFIIGNMYDSEKGFAHTIVNGKSRIYRLLRDQVLMAYAPFAGFALSSTVQYLVYHSEQPNRSLNAL